MFFKVSPINYPYRNDTVILISSSFLIPKSELLVESNISILISSPGTSS